MRSTLSKNCQKQSKTVESFNGLWCVFDAGTGTIVTSLPSEHILRVFIVKKPAVLDFCTRRSCGRTLEDAYIYDADVGGWVNIVQKLNDGADVSEWNDILTFSGAVDAVMPAKRNKIDANFLVRVKDLADKIVLHVEKDDRG